MQEIKMNGESLNIEQENIAKLKEIFPEVFNEDKIDFEKLQNVLGHYIDTDEEKYRFTWNGKMDALRLSQTPSTGTLRPCKEESRDWDTTQNLYIEGDNLEVLKLLQNSYLNKIKMIYIDPPYNTGNDFVYKDDFKDNITNYKKMTGQIDSEGNSTSTNKETDGRYHTNWLNMIYPRLRLARNLLTDDGVIFISIDDNEVTNLKKICDEIFGIDNFINIISAKTKNIAGASGGGEDKRLKKNIEYILIYAKNYDAIEPFKKIYNRTEISELLNKYREENISWKYTSILRKRGEKIYFKSTLDGDGNEIKIYKRINPEYSSVSQIMKEENISEAAVYVKYFHDIYTTAMPQSSIRVRVMDAINEDNNSECDLYSIEYVPKTGKNKGKVYEQFYKGDKFRLFTWFSDVAEMENGIVYKNDMLGTLWDKINLNNLTKEGNIKYDNGKKPIELVKKLIEMISTKNDIICDFFSGSATTAHATIELNTKDNENRKFILVQLPEKILPTTKDNIEYIEYLNQEKIKPYVTEIGKERIRRAGDKIKEEIEQENQQLKLGEEPKKLPDIGFKVFKLDSSNIRKWNPDTKDLERTLLDQVDNFVEGRKEEDALYEIILKNGLPLTVPVEELNVKGKKVYSIGMGAMIVCLDNNITLDIADEIAKISTEFEDKGMVTVVFKDNGFENDSVKTNIKESLRGYGIGKFVTV